MSWQKYFDKIFIINLKHRQDRLERVTEIMSEYGIDAFVFEAIEHENGAFGLSFTMKKLFNQCLASEFERVLVFEDDVEFLERPDMLNEYMNKCVDDLKKIDWNIFYLGLQHVAEFFMWKTKNILPVHCGYGTHACAYSKEAMQFFVDRTVLEPIDNFLVREFQPKGTCFAAYPLLATQADTYSDICKNKPNFDEVIRYTYEKNIRDIMQYRTQF